MVKNYQRKTLRYDGAALQHCVDLKRAKLATVDQLSATYGIPKSTIYFFAKPGAPPVPEKPTQGRKPIFSQEEEKEIVDFVIRQAERFHPISRRGFARLCFDMAKKKGEEARMQSNTEGVRRKTVAGPAFLHGFLRRHPEIRFKAGVNMSISRIQGYNYESVMKFFDHLETLVEEHALNATQIFNVDESGFNLVQKSRDAYLGKCNHELFLLQKAERGRNVTMLGCCSASGQFIPPMFIFRQGTGGLQEALADTTYCKYDFSKNGWINSDLFLKWLQHFRETVSTVETVLLILDNHSSHLSLEAIEYCRENSIIVLTLPPHTSHELQPLDCGFFSPLKARFGWSIEEWKRAPGNAWKIPKDSDIPRLLEAAYFESARVEVAEKAFSYTGIWDKEKKRPTREIYDGIFVNGKRKRRLPIRFAPSANFPEDDNSEPQVELVVPEMPMESDNEDEEDALLTEPASSTVNLEEFRVLIDSYGVPPVPTPGPSTRRKQSSVASSDESFALIKANRKKKVDREKTKVPRGRKSATQRKKPKETPTATVHNEAASSKVLRSSGRLPKLVEMNLYM